MPAAVLVIGHARLWQQAQPQHGTVLHKPCLHGDAYVSDLDIPAIGRARPQNMRGAKGGKGDRALCNEARPQRFCLQAANAGRHIDGDTPPAALGQLRGDTVQRPGQAATKQAIQNKVMRRLERLFQCSHFGVPERCSLRSIAGQLCHRHHAVDFHIPPKLRQLGRRDKAIAAISAGAAQDLDGSFRPVGVNEFGDGIAGALHQFETVESLRKHRLFGGLHFLRCEYWSAHDGLIARVLRPGFRIQ